MGVLSLGVGWIAAGGTVLTVESMAVTRVVEAVESVVVGRSAAVMGLAGAGVGVIHSHQGGRDEQRDYVAVVCCSEFQKWVHGDGCSKRLD